MSIRILMVYRHFSMIRHNSLESSTAVCYHPILNPYSLLTLLYQQNKQFVNEQALLENTQDIILRENHIILIVNLDVLASVARSHHAD